jgi:phosphoglucomutase
LPPNEYLAVCLSYLYWQRTGWPAAAAVGKTVVSSSMIDRVSAEIGRKVYEVPVGFKFFVDGLLNRSLGFAGEESAGSSFLARDGAPWSTDKDGIIAALLSAEITARCGKDPGEIYSVLTETNGRPVYERIDAPATSEQRIKLAKLSPQDIPVSELAGEHIDSVLTTAPGDGSPIGGIKVVTRNGWFAARPSGTENVYKIYAESFRGRDHLIQIQKEAQSMIADVFNR